MGVSEIAGYASDKLDLTDSKAVSEFVKTHQMTAEQDGNKVSISFVLDTGAILSEMTEGEFEGGKIKGEMTIEKDSGKVLSFEYDLKDYFTKVQDTMKEDGEKYEVVSDDFDVKYKATDTSPDDVKIDGEAKQYTADNIHEFAYKFDRLITYDFEMPEIE